MEFGIPFAALGVIAACSVVIAFPVYFLFADRRRRGETVTLSGLSIAILVGGIGVVAVLLFLFARA
jgi:hypothetical protein